MARKEEERTARLERLRGEILLGIDEVKAGQSVAMTEHRDIRQTLDDCYSNRRRSALRRRTLKLADEAKKNASSPSRHSGMPFVGGMKYWSPSG